MIEREGLVHVYTGTGKGKTTTSLGLALRALGHNLSVYMVQFMKSGDTGELFSVQKYLPNFQIIQFGKDALAEKQLKIYSFEGKEADVKQLSEEEIYTFRSDDDEKEPARMGFEHAKRIVMNGQYDLVILDEINCVLDKKLIPVEEVLELIQQKPRHVELVLTGRGAPAEILKAADYVSEIRRIKHPYDVGILARKGIEY